MQAPLVRLNRIGRENNRINRNNGPSPERMSPGANKIAKFNSVLRLGMCT